MILELEPYQVITVLGTIAGSIWAAGKALFSRFDESLRERDNNLGADIKALSSQMEVKAQTIRKLDRDILNLKAELPREYVAKADFVRSFTVVEAKIDKVYQLLSQKNS